jgi:hypothetical protein
MSFQDRYSSNSVELSILKNDLPLFYHTVDGKDMLGTWVILII